MDEINWWAVTQKLGPQLFRFFRCRFGTVDAEELVQEVFLRLVDKVESNSFFASKGSPEALAWGIALNVQREHRRYLAKNAVPPDQPSIDTISDPIQFDHSAQQEIAALLRSVRILTEPQRTIMGMVLADLSLDEISAAFAMPAGTIKSHVHRAKEEIRKTFKHWRML